MVFGRCEMADGAKSHWLPLFFDAGSGTCLVVGGGKVALRKIETLMEYGCDIEVVAKEAISEIQGLAQKGKIQLRLREASLEDLEGKVLVIVATDDNRTNRLLSSWARQRGILCNVVDSPDLCNVIFPAVFRNGRITLAVSTEGASPALAAKLRDSLAREIGPAWAIAAEIIGEIRIRLKEEKREGRGRMELLRGLAQEEFLECCARGNPEEIAKVVFEKTGLEMDLERARTIVAQFQKK